MTGADGRPGPTVLDDGLMPGRLGLTAVGWKGVEQEQASVHLVLVLLPLKALTRKDHLLREPENCRLWCRKGHMFSKIALTVAFYHLAIASIRG